MKILIVRMYPNEMNINSYNCQEIGLAKALIRKGIVCDIVLYTKENEHEEDFYFDDDYKKIHIYYLKAREILKNSFFSDTLYNIVDKYDIVQTAEYDQMGNIKLRNKSNNKMIIYHGPYDSKYTKGYKIKCLFSDLYYMFHKEYKNTICISKSILASEFLKRKSFNNIYTIGVGLDTERFNSNDTNEEINQIIQNKEKKQIKYLLYIGKLEERRNVPFLIDILHNEVKKNINVNLIIIGNGDDKYIEQCMNYAREKKVLDKIIYIKSINQSCLPALYHTADVFLLPTRYEIFGMVLLEAMFFGVPVITTYNGGSSTLIDNKKNGFICAENNVEEWTSTIESIISNDEYKNEISKNSKETIIDNYTWDKIADKFIEVYKKIVNKKEKNEYEVN